MSVLARTPEMVERKPGFIPGVSRAGHTQLPSMVVVPSTICPYGGQPPE